MDILTAFERLYRFFFFFTVDFLENIAWKLTVNILNLPSLIFQNTCTEHYPPTFSLSLSPSLPPAVYTCSQFSFPSPIYCYILSYLFLSSYSSILYCSAVSFPLPDHLHCGLVQYCNLPLNSKNLWSM